MVEWLIVIALILAGIAIILIEVIFVPGTTVVGIAGFFIGCYGIYSSYQYFGTPTGHFVLGFSLIAMATTIVVALKSNAWKRFSLYTSIDAKVNEDFTYNLEIGSEGISTSALRPVGKALFGEYEIEVCTFGEYLREKLPIRIVKIVDKKYYVEQIK